MVSQIFQLAGQFRLVTDDIRSQLEITEARLRSVTEARLNASRAYHQRLGKDSHFAKNGTSSNELPLFVTITLPDGGLGNFMFDIASLIGIARKNKRIPVLIRPEPRLLLFEGINLKLVSEKKIFPAGKLDKWSLHEHGPGKFASEMHNLTKLFPNNTVVVRGYLQSWKYFDHVRDEIKAMFTFKEQTLSIANERIITGLRHIINLPVAHNNETFRLVGIHVRRGDILRDPHKEHGHVPASDQYLLRTTLQVQIKYPSAVYFVLSNNISYCKDLFPSGNFIFVENVSPEVDMAIMSFMDVMIISVGTYGWWGTYLSDAQEVFYYKDWPRNGSNFQKSVNLEDYFLPSWQGKI